MSSNRSTLDALAQEGIPMTEEQLISEAQKIRSDPNSAIPALAKGQRAYNDSTSPTMTTVNAEPSNGRLHGESAQLRPAVGVLPRASGEARLLVPRGRQRTPNPRLIGALCLLGIHKGRWAFVADGDCTQGRECGRCGAVDVRTRHDYKWRYESAMSCTEHRACVRCKNIRLSQVDVTSRLTSPYSLETTYPYYRSTYSFAQRERGDRASLRYQGPSTTAGGSTNLRAVVCKFASALAAPT